MTIQREIARPRVVPRRRRLSAGWRKTVLLLHVSLSLGWLGMSATTLVMSIVTLSETRPDVLSAVFEFEELLSVFLGRPMAVGALVTGLILSFGTKWRLFRYYWVLVKFVLLIAMVAAAVILLPRWIANGTAQSANPGSAELVSAQWGLIVVAALHVTGLVVSAALSVYKPPLRIRRPA